MKDFWVWATEHWFLTFVLAWSGLATARSFFSMFHRSPRVTAEQFEALQTQLKQQPQTLAQLVDSRQHLDETTPRQPSRAPTWHERLK